MPDIRRTGGTFTPTGEQRAIREDAATRPNDGRKVTAAAGSGKTRSLLMLADDRRDPGMYLAFSRPIKDEAEQRFPRHIRVRTPHGAAYGDMNVAEMKPRLEGRLFGDMVERLVRLPRSRMPNDALGQVVLDSVARFCNSADRRLTIKHVALDPGEPEDVRMAALAGAEALWARMSDRNDACPITHDTYLKLWQLGEARIRNIDWILFDEAQDASPVMIDVMVRQGLPITWVGDEHQQIFAWRGAVNAMRLMPGREFTLSKSFRFGKDVAMLANAVLSCKPEGTRPSFQIVGNPERESQIGRMPKGLKHAFLSRTNAEWFDEALSFPGLVHVIGGLDETERLLLGAWELWRHGRRPDRCPAIARFTSWSKLCEHAEQFEDRELTFARRIVEQHRERLPAAVADLRSRYVEHEIDADLILSTAHKAKGREFAYVRLGEGFQSPLDPKWLLMPPDLQEAELNLLYVALTRAIEGLQPCLAVTDCLALQRGKTKPGQPMPPVKLVEIKPKIIGIAPPAAVETPVAAPGSTTSSSVSPSNGFVPWSPYDDSVALTLASNGVAHSQIALKIGRSEISTAVRLAMLGAPGSDPSLPSQVLAALVPVPRISGSPPSSARSDTV